MEKFQIHTSIKRIISNWLYGRRKMDFPYHSTTAEFFRLRKTIILFICLCLINRCIFLFFIFMQWKCIWSNADDRDSLYLLRYFYDSWILPDPENFKSVFYFLILYLHKFHSWNWFCLFYPIKDYSKKKQIFPLSASHNISKSHEIYRYWQNYLHIYRIPLFYS